MSEHRPGIYSLNSGEISRLSLARIDLAKLRLAAEVQENFLPFVLGPMMVRPGTAFVARGNNDLPAFLFEFKKAVEFSALLVATSDNLLQILDAATDTFVSRPTVSATITNGDFTGGTAGWTDASEVGGVVSLTTSGFLGLTGTGTNYAWVDQLVSVSEVGIEHGLRIRVFRGDVVVKIGSSQGAGDYWDVQLAEGEYSLAFKPAGSFWVRLGARSWWTSYVDYARIDFAGRLSLPHPWGASDFANLQYDRSEDVLFVACKGFQQRRIERRNTTDMRSWGIALYRVDDGPFRPANLGSTTLLNSGVSRSITLTASRAFFHPGQQGALFRLTHPAQTTTAVLAGAEQFTGNIRISGVGDARAFVISLSGISGSTVTLQRSFTDPGAWVDVGPYTTNGSVSFNDGLDNQIFWYRMIVHAAGYASGNVIQATLEHSGSQTGVVRVRDIVNSVLANADVLNELGAVGPTADWAEGEWSDYRGWPVAVAFHDGRLFWQNDLRAQGSVSDAFNSFDSEVLGDAGPINRTTVASDPHWMVSALRLLIGTTLQEISVRASAFDEPLTATAFVPRQCSDRGSMQMRAVNVDGRVFFVGRDTRRVFLLEYDAAKGDFVPLEVTRLNQEIGAPGVVDMAAQRQPDTRLHFVLGDGRVIVLVHEPNENVSALVPFTFSGDAVERVACLPGVEEDKVYIYVHRGGVRCIERFAMRSECQAGTFSKTVDSHVVYQGAPSTVISGLDHIDGRNVAVWADGMPQQNYLPVIAGSATLPVAASNIVAGLSYDAKFKSAKLAASGQDGSSLAQQKRVGPIAFVMADVAWKGVRIGRDFDHMVGLPATYRGRPLLPTESLREWDMASSAFNGGWNSDSRICIKVSSPYCCTMMGIVFGEQVNAGEDIPPSRNG